MYYLKSLIITERGTYLNYIFTILPIKSPKINLRLFNSSPMYSQQISKKCKSLARESKGRNESKWEEREKSLKR
jgi:hypothetical protein